MENIVVHYDGFFPAQDVQEDIDVYLQEILLEAPNGASVSGSFTKKHDLIKGVVHVNSSAGPFFAIMTGFEVKDVARRLLGNMRRRFDKWKMKRMSHQGLRSVFISQNQF